MRYVTTETDPCGTFAGIKKGKLLAACGLIPYFVQEAALSGPLTATEVMDVMRECYGFPTSDLLERGTGEVSEGGQYSHPEDPPLDPMVKWTMDGTGVEVFMYQYALVCVRDDETTQLVRMD